MVLCVSIFYQAYFLKDAKYAKILAFLGNLVDNSIITPILKSSISKIEKIYIIYVYHN